MNDQHSIKGNWRADAGRHANTYKPANTDRRAEEIRIFPPAGGEKPLAPILEG